MPLRIIITAMAAMKREATFATARALESTSETRWQSTPGTFQPGL